MSCPEDLPLYAHLPEIADRLAQRGLLLLHADPGAGKSTLVPWHLLGHRAFAAARILLLQPRRIAARAAAERIAGLLGERVGQRVGLRTRMETLTGPKTRLEVATEGILTRIVQNDPSLSGYGTVIFDEFHERNLQAEMALAFTWECREHLNPGLNLLFMSATPPAAELTAALGKMDFLSFPGRSWPVSVLDRPPLREETPWQGAARLAAEARRLLDGGRGGAVLVFLPGLREILRTREELLRQHPGLAAEIQVLHGRLPPAQQRRVLDPPPGPSRRIILATNVAETSLTIPDVSAVVDSGLERRVRFHPRTGMDHWETAEISQASALQRQGRAGRLGPGICLRWWRSTDARRAFSNPEILEADLAQLALETAFWGAPSPLEMTWITPPPLSALQQANGLLAELGLIDARGRITPLGRRAAGLGLHPRLARMVLAAADRGLTATAALAAAILEEGDPLPGHDADFRDRLSAWVAAARHAPGGLPPETAERISREARRILHAANSSATALSPDKIDPSLAGTLLLSAYPDRAARRAGGGLIGEEGRFVLATGRGARVTGPLAGEEYLAVAELDGGDREARVFLAAPLLRAELEGSLSDPPREVACFTWEGWMPRCRMERRVGWLVLEAHPGKAPPPEELRQATVERIAREGISILPWSDAARRLLARCRFVERFGRRQGWPGFSDAILAEEIDQWLLPWGNWDGRDVFRAEILCQALSGRLGWENRRALDELAPETWKLPSGTARHLDYETADRPVLAARIQEFFGCRKTPALCGEPLMLHLLSPAGRPVQITQDLDGFWDRAYPLVRRELLGRYPRHPWPDNPRSAEPTSRAKRRSP
jgi:ATP-dependent helicase HrpB